DGKTAVSRPASTPPLTVAATEGSTMRFPRVWFAPRRTSPPIGAAETGPSRDGVGKRKRSFRVVALIGLAATCGALGWRARGVRDRLDPVPALIAALKDPRPDVRTNAAVRLGFVASDPRSAGADTIAASTRALETALKDPSDQVRGGAAYGLGRIGTAG